MGKFSGFLGGKSKDEKGTESTGTKVLPAGGSTAVMRQAAPRGSGSLVERRDIYAARGHVERTVEAREGNIALVMDFTGSMDKYLQMARAEMTEILHRIGAEVGKVTVKFRFYGYRDYDEDTETIAISPLSGDAEEIIGWLNNVRCFGGYFQGDAGHDQPEALERGLEEATHGEYKAVLVFGDCPGHPRHELDKKGRRQQRDSFQLAQEFGERGIPIHTFVIGKVQETIDAFRKIAEMSGGKTGRLDGSADMRDMAVMAVLERLAGKRAVQSYIERNELTDGNAANFGRLLLTNGGK